MIDKKLLQTIQRRIFIEYDPEGTGFLTESKAKHYIADLLRDKLSLTDDVLDQAYNEIDTERKGFVSIEDLAFFFLRIEELYS